jgi:D-3-phosphoglycerate dehydrogenase
MSPRLSVPKDRLKFVLLENIHQSAVDSLALDGYTNVTTYPKALAGDELVEAIRDAHFVGIRSRTQLTAAVLEQATKLTAVGAFSNTRSVAELVLAEIIMLMRGIPEKNAILHRGGWVKSAAHSWEVRGKVLGIVGYGHIGTQIGVLAEQLGMTVIFYDVETKLALGNARQVPSLDDLMSTADVVTLHVPDNPSTRNMIGARQLEIAKRGSFLINASRGTVVDIDALAAALESRHLLGAAIDVFPVEPEGNDARFESPLIRFDNVILTPHIGGSTGEAQVNIGKEVAAKLIRYSNNGSTNSAVNFPEVSLPEHEGKCRLLHIHHNVPGVLAQINERFSRGGVNISAQYLQTDAEIGYVVIDIDGDASQVAYESLCDIPGTIRCRILY